MRKDSFKYILTRTSACAALALVLAPMGAVRAQDVPSLFPETQEVPAVEDEGAPPPEGLMPAESEAPGAEAAAPGNDIPDFFSDGPANDLTAPEGESSETGTFDFEKSKDQLEEEARREAFNAALEGLLPLRPEEIRELLEKFDRTQESVELPVYPAPRPEFAVETLSLDPGTKPSVVKVAHGNVTTLTFLDSTGAPWPIEDISWAGNFEISHTGQNGAHIVRISPQSEFAQGNMSVRLLTLKTPVIISMETSRDIVHYRFDAIIPDYGPLAEAPLIDQGITITAGDENIAAVLQGVMPKDAKKLLVSGVDGRTTAYSHAGQTYVRTPLTMLSPSWSSSVSSADGMKVYAIQDAPVLLLSDKGKMVRARLSERGDILE